MKSAYIVLGIPGNVDPEEIEEAYQRATRLFSREKLLENPELVAKLDEIKAAHKVLSNPEMREAHDRKLRQTVARPLIQPVVVEERPGFGLGSLLKVSALLVVALFAVGAYLQHVRQAALQAEAEQALAQKQLDAEAEARAAREKELLDAARATRDREAENRERQLRAESLAEGRLISMAEAQRQAAIARQAAIDHNVDMMDERAREAEAQRKLAEYRAIMSRRRWGAW